MRKNHEELVCAVRSLNQWRPLHLPAYVGLRLMLESVVMNESPWIDPFVSWQMPIRKNPRYWHFQQFKGLDSNSMPEYREFFASSPTTAVAESWCLRKLSSVNEFKKDPHVFSYLWPFNSNYGRDYDFFAVGYQNRNKKVKHLLNQNPDLVAVIVDIKRFYPSIDADKVLERTRRRLENQDLTSRERKTVTSVFEGMLSIVENGVPIGPPLSHVCGDLALEVFDAKMSEKYGDFYTRYVDDIIVVVNSAKAKEVKGDIISILSDEGLELNEGKSDVVSSSEWSDNVPTLHLRPLPGSFEELKLRLISFLATKPEQFEALNDAFRENGFQMPLQRMRMDSGYGRMRRYLSSFLRRSNLYLFKVRQDSVGSLVDSCSSLRGRLKKDFEECLRRPKPRGITMSKWHSQAKRYVLNRLLYLLPEVEYRALLNEINTEPDLIHHAELLRGLVNGNATSIVHMPGPPVSAFAFLAGQIGLRPVIDWSMKPTRAIVDSISVLVLNGLVTPPVRWLRECLPADQELLGFCIPSKTPKEENDFSFTNEILSLLGNRKRDDLNFMLSSRFNDMESVWFDMLDLGEDYTYG